MESEFLSIGNSIFLFTAFFSSKIRFNKAEIRISLKNTFPLDGKKSCSCLRKMERKKMFCTIQKISFPPARMSSFSKNYFRLIPMMVSTSSEIALFPLGRRILKNTFPLYGKAASTLKNIWWNWFPLAGMWFVFQNGLPPNFNNGVYLQKKTRNKIIDKTDKNLVSIFPICSS